MRGKAFNRICLALFLLAWANGMAFVAVGKRIGGEAFHGKVEDGRYYLARGYFERGPTRDIGQYTEVSPTLFRYSLVHVYSVLVTSALGLIAAFAGTLFQQERKT